MKNISILLTDNNSINEKIIVKSLKKLKNCKLNNIIFIGDKKLFCKIYSFSKNIDKFIFLNINLNKKNYFEYLKKITLASIRLFKEKKIQAIINMPLDKKKFLNNKFFGYTEFFSYYFDNKKNETMLLYSDKFSVSPLTTHVEIKNVDKTITKNKLIISVKNIVNFYKKKIKKKIQIIVLSLNPHASKDLQNRTKDETHLRPIVKYFSKKKVNIIGPISSDTAFNNFKNKVYLGMYHDQVLIPFKMMNKFKGINITIGKNLLRLSPDHGPAKQLNNNKNKSQINNQSFIECIKFCEKFNV